MRLAKSIPAVLISTLLSLSVSVPARAESAALRRVGEWVMSRMGRKILAEFAEGTLLQRHYGLPAPGESFWPRLANVPKEELAVLDRQISLLNDALRRGVTLKDAVQRYLFTRETEAGIQFVRFQGWRSEDAFPTHHYETVLPRMNAVEVRAIDPADALDAAAVLLAERRLQRLARYFEGGSGTDGVDVVELLRERLIRVTSKGGKTSTLLALDDYVFTFEELETLFADELRIRRARRPGGLSITHLTLPGYYIPSRNRRIVEKLIEATERNLSSDYAQGAYAEGREDFLSGQVERAPTLEEFDQSLLGWGDFDQAAARYGKWHWGE